MSDLSEDEVLLLFDREVKMPEEDRKKYRDLFKEHNLDGEALEALTINEITDILKLSAGHKIKFKKFLTRFQGKKGNVENSSNAKVKDDHTKTVNNSKLMNLQGSSAGILGQNSHFHVNDVNTTTTNIYLHSNYINNKEKVNELVRGSNLVHLTLRCNKIQMVEYLLKHEDDLNRLDDSGLSPLMLAAAQGLEDIAELLISNGALVDKTGFQSDTPLHMAASAGQAAMCQLLFKYNCSDAIRNSDGNCAIHIAAWRGHLEVVEVLIRKNPASATFTTKNNNTLLHMAAFQGHIHVMRYFLEECEVAVDILGSEGCTSLMVAAQEGRTNAVRWLLKNDASPMRYDTRYSWTALLYACVANQADTVELLIKAGSDLHARTVTNYTPLHWATYNGRLDIVQMLCDAGARGDLFDNPGDSPLGVASLRGHSAIYDFLRERFPGVKERRT